MKEKKEPVEHYLREEIANSGLKQNWLAKRMSMHHVLLSDYLRGVKNMPRAVEYRLIKALEYMEKMDLK